MTEINDINIESADYIKKAMSDSTELQQAEGKPSACFYLTLQN